MLSLEKSVGSLIHKRGFAIAVGTTLSLCTLAPAQAATFRISWTGQILGYSAEGRFSYDDTQTYEDGIVRGDDLDAFDITFYDPQGTLIQAFEDNHLTYSGFNFNFDTQTQEILQDGFFDEPNGIDIGEYTVLFDDAGEPIGATGLNFWSAAPLTPDGEPIPHVHLTDFGNEFPDLPIGFGSHLDVAFFTRTRAQLLDDPGAGDQLGQRMIATQVPEPGTLAGLGAIALLTLRLRRTSQVTR
ncbi:MAG: PEP-CTERM sorting domain-containing protein [Cyanobacteria bacterium J06642_9]